MKILKNLAIIILTLIISLSVFSVCVSAASNASISFSSSTVTVGNSVTVTVTVNPGQTFNAVSYNVNYDENVLQFVSSEQATGGAGVLKVVESFADKTSVSYSMVFTAIATGNCAFSVENCLWSAGGSSETPIGGASATLSVKDPVLSSNANLKSLSLSSGKLSPKFSASRTSYTSKVLYEVTKVNVSANVADGSAKVVSVTGNSNLQVGDNTVVVTVQAADGTQKKYTIVVTRLKEGEIISTEDETGEETVIDATKLETIVAGTTYTVSTELPEDKILNGFEASTVDYNGIEVPVAIDEAENYVVYYLKSADSDELIPFIYDSELKTFELLKYLVLDGKVYIFEEFPDEYAIPEGLYPSNLKISDFSVECLSISDETQSDFHYVYCYFGAEYGIYRYDSLENTLQRYPQLKLVKLSDVEENDNLLARFSSLSTNGKIIFICLIVAVLGAIALIVFLVIYLIKRFSKGNDDILLESLDDDFDEIVEDDQYSKDEDIQELTETEE